MKTENSVVVILLKQQLKFHVSQDGVVCHKTYGIKLITNNCCSPKLIIHWSFKSCTRTMVHLVVKRFLDLILKRFYWPQMSKKMECVNVSRKNWIDRPMIHTIDFLHLDKFKHGYTSGPGPFYRFMLFLLNSALPAS